MALRDVGDVLARIEAEPLGRAPEAMRAAFARRLGEQAEAQAVPGGLAVGRGPTLLWLHGGGYVFGAPETHVNLAHALAEQGVRVVLPRYRLAPEHPWPAMLEDALAALDAVTGPVALGGESAGGHLALNAALARPGRAAALVLFSPNTDRTGLSATRGSTRDAMNDDEGDRALGRMAMGGVADDDPAASPLLADLSALPPLHLSVASDEVLLDDTLLLARRAALAGVAVDLRVTPGLFHMFQLWPQAIPEGAWAAARAGAYAGEALAARSSAG